MNFLTSTPALIAAAMAVPTLVILYFLKLRRRDLEVSTTLLWKKAIQDLQANAPFQRLRRNILLFLQLLVLGAVLFALAQPIIKGQGQTGNKLVIMIDRSGSMSASDVTDASGKPLSRLELAKQQAVAMVESMKVATRVFGEKDSGDQAMIVAFDNAAETLHPFSSDKVALKAAIESIQGTDKTTSVGQAVQVALANLPKKRMIENGNETVLEGLYEGEPIEMHLFTDGRIPDSAKARPGPENKVVFHQVGTEDAANVGITGLKAEREFENANQLTIFVSLLNTQKTARDVDVELLIDGAVAGIKTATIPAASTGDVGLSAPEAARADAREREAAAAVGAKDDAPRNLLARPGAGGVVFKLERETGALAQIRLRDPSTGESPAGDVLSADNRAWLAIPPAKRMSIAVVGRSNLFIKSALEGLPLARLDMFTQDQFEKAWADGKAGVYDVVILDGVIPSVGQEVVAATPAGSPPAAPGTTPGTTPAAPSAPPTGAGSLGISRTLPAGNFLVLGAIPAKSGLTDLGLSEGGAHIIDWSRDHPATRYLVLDPLAVAKFTRVGIEPGKGIITLATAETGPAIVELTTIDTHAIVVPFDYMESNWPLDLSFVVFLASSVQYLGQEVTGGFDARAIVPGSELRDRLPQGAKDVAVRAPDVGGATTTQPLSTDSDGGIVYRVPPVSGVLEVTWDGAATPSDVREPGGSKVLRMYASNLLDMNESDVAAAKSVELASADVAAQATRSTKADRRLWPYFLLVGLGIVLFEWFIYNRKVYV